MTPGRGLKTTTTVNLARTLAMTGSRVLVLDCDLRKPKVHEYFGMSQRHGMSEFLAGVTLEQSELLQQVNEQIDLIAAGPVPPNPSELLHAKRFEYLLNESRKSYDFILIDSPPVLSVTDSLIISNQVDGTLIIVKAGKTTYEIMHSGLKRLRSVKARLLGMVLNEVRMKKDGYYYYQGYYTYQGYYFSETEKKAKKHHRRWWQFWRV